MNLVLEGKWEELVAQHPDLAGHQVRIIVIDETLANRNPWLESLREWSQSHQAIGHEVDVSRDAMYTI